jgi:hypothetical protein
VRTKELERTHARELRGRGLSIEEIARVTGVSVSSVSNWVRDVPLDEEHRVALRRRVVDGHRRGSEANRAQARSRRRSFQARGRATALLGDPMHAAGAMLYWAEGSRQRNAVVFTNSDPDMVRYFVRYLRRCFGVTDESFALTCNLFADHVEGQRQIEQFWLDTLELPNSCLRKSTVNVYSKYSQKKRKNRLPYGTARVCVHSTELVQQIYGAIQEYGGFERPEWLG